MNCLPHVLGAALFARLKQMSNKFLFWLTWKRRVVVSFINRKCGKNYWE